MKKQLAAKTKAKQELIKKLLRTPVKATRFTGNKITITFAGHKITDQIRLEREKHVAEWSRRRKQVIIDKHFGSVSLETSFRALCVHEAIEKFLAEHYGLTVDKQAHPIACQKEKEYLEKHGGNWRSHELTVYWDWHKQGDSK